MIDLQLDSPFTLPLSPSLPAGRHRGEGFVVSLAERMG